MSQSAEPDRITVMDAAALDLGAIAAVLRRRFGPRADAWTRDLPGRVTALAGRWRLDVRTTFGRGSSSVVFRCDGPRGGTVLKLCPDPALLAEEAAMLRLFEAGGRVPRVYEQDGDAMVMELIEPGTPVETLPAPSATRYARFLRDLHAGGDVDRAPRRLYGWTEVLFHAAVRDGVDLGDARERRDELIATQTRQVLLHGDLHLGNVLDGGARGLFAVDPTACVGDPCFDAVDYVLEGLSCPEILRRRDELAKAADLDVERLDRWCRVTAPIGAGNVNPRHRAALLDFMRTAPLRG